MLITLQLNQEPQHLHANDKKIRGQRVALSDTPRGQKGIQLPTIEQHRDGGSGEAAKNQLSEGAKKLVKKKHVPNKMPF